MNGLLIKLFKDHMNEADLGIKGEIMEQVGAMELDAMGLDQSQLVVTSLKYLSLIHILQTSSGEVSFSSDEHCALGILQCDGLI